MLYKGRSRNMGHVTRTMRIDIDLLFERLKTDKGIFFKYVNTKEQLADMLTKGSVTAATWGYLIDFCCLGPITAGSNTMQGKQQQEPPRPKQQQLRQHPNQERQQQGVPNKHKNPSFKICMSHISNFSLIPFEGAKTLVCFGSV